MADMLSGYGCAHMMQACTCMSASLVECQSSKLQAQGQQQCQQTAWLHALQSARVTACMRGGRGGFFAFQKPLKTQGSMCRCQKPHRFMRRWQDPLPCAPSLISPGGRPFIRLHSHGLTYQRLLDSSWLFTACHHSVFFSFPFFFFFPEPTDLCAGGRAPSPLPGFSGRQKPHPAAQPRAHPPEAAGSLDTRGMPRKGAAIPREGAAIPRCSLPGLWCMDQGQRCLCLLAGHRRLGGAHAAAPLHLQVLSNRLLCQERT